MDIKDIESLLQLLKQNDISELELEQDGTKLKATRGVVVQHVAQAPSVSTHVEPAITANGQATHAAHPTQAPAINPNLKKVESPIVGTFYRKPSPDAAVFAKEGDRVKKGSTLCIIEAMKVMNEIESPCDGVIERILPADGEVVEFGEVLFLINP